MNFLSSFVSKNIILAKYKLIHKFSFKKTVQEFFFKKTINIVTF